MTDQSDPMLMLLLAIIGVCFLVIVGYGVQELSESIFSPTSVSEEIH